MKDYKIDGVMMDISTPKPDTRIRLKNLLDNVVWAVAMISFFILGYVYLLAFGDK